MAYARACEGELVVLAGRLGRPLGHRFGLTFGSASGRCDQTGKGIRWMTWRQEAMKDVGTCDKLQGAGNRAVICRSLNGETHPQGYRALNA